MQGMPARLYRFEWPVDQAGYEIVRERGSEGSLIDSYDYREIRGRGGPPRFYSPLDERPGLWLRFVEACDSPEGVLTFANGFGLLSEQFEMLDRVITMARYIRQIAAALDKGNRETAAELFNKWAMPRLTADIAWNDKGTALEFKLAPLTLGAALWLQCGEAITGGKRFRRCRNCAEYFRVGTGGHTERREFCSDRCRVAAAYKRKRAGKAIPARP
jgi:hypothetical protein